MNGYFITFEGGEGSGKTTQLRRLAERLRAEAREVVETREPGGSAGADALRRLILSGQAEKYGAKAEAALFAAARIDHLEGVIRPALARGAVVLCDRFHDSTRVYQGLDGEMDAVFLSRLEQATLGGTMPDLTFILDIPAGTGLERARRRRGGEKADRFEKEDVELHERRRWAFQAIAVDEPERCLLLDAERAEESLAEEIAETALDRMTAAQLDAVGRSMRPPATGADHRA